MFCNSLLPPLEGSELVESITKLPILVDGILTAEDVSLEEVGLLTDVSFLMGEMKKANVGSVGRVPVLLDGGIRRGIDIFKATDLGAQAVLGGRSILYGLAVGGEVGVKQVLDMLREELDLSLSLSSCSKLKGHHKGSHSN
eukprot:Gb_25825 [translate_table: standard]